MTAKARAIVGRWYSIPLLLVVWGAAVASGLVQSRLLPGPGAVWDALTGETANGALVYHAGVTVSRALTGFLLAALIGMVTSHGVGIVVFAGVLGFTNALTLTLALALPSMLSAPDDVHRTSAGMFTISYSCAMVLSIVGGWLWDLTAVPVASFAPVALCAIVIVVLASTVKNARQ